MMNKVNNYGEKKFLIKLLVRDGICLNLLTVKKGSEEWKNNLNIKPRSERTKV
jgi:hypothetical protein